MNYNVGDYRIDTVIAIEKLITISMQRFTGGYFFRGENHDFYEAVCVLEGTVGVTGEKEIFLLSAGQMTIHRPMEFHAIWEHENSNPKCIIFSFRASEFPRITSRIYHMTGERLRRIREIYDLSKDIFVMAPVSRPAEESAARSIFDCGESVVGICEGKANAAFRLIKRMEIFLSESLEFPADPQKEYRDTSGKHYKKILQVMEENINTGLCLAELSEKCNLSIPSIEKTIRRYLQCGAMEYYQNLRMNRALCLLRTGESVKKVALTLHFSTQHYFSLCFKKHFGYPPSRVEQ